MLVCKPRGQADMVEAYGDTGFEINTGSVRCPYCPFVVLLDVGSSRLDRETGPKLTAISSERSIQGR